MEGIGCWGIEKKVKSPDKDVKADRVWAVSSFGDGQFGSDEADLAGATVSMARLWR